MSLEELQKKSEEHVASLDRIEAAHSGQPPVVEPVKPEAKPEEPDSTRQMWGSVADASWEEQKKAFEDVFVKKTKTLKDIGGK